MADIKLAQPASSAVTITLTSLASDPNLLAGRESTAIDNSTNLYLDYLLAGQIRNGASTATVNKEIRVYVAGLLNDTTWPDVLDGTDSAETITSANVRDASMRLAAIMTVDTTADRYYYFAPISVAALFGGQLPKKFVVFVVHNIGVALSATAGDHIISITPVYETVA